MKRLSLIFASIFATINIYASSLVVDSFQGMNTEESKIAIDPTKSPDMDNMELSVDGTSIHRRDGQTKLFTITYSTDSVKSFGSVKNDTYDKLLVGYGQSVVAYDKAYGSTVIHSSATDNNIWSFAQYQDYTYAVNGVDTDFKTDGNIKTFITAAPKGRCQVFFNNTWFIARTTDNKARVYWSVLGDPSDWTLGADDTDSGYVDVADYGEQIVELQVLGDSVIILCTSSIMKIIGEENPYQVSEVDKSIGCKSKGSVSTQLGFTYFLGTDGQFYRTDGYAVQNISKDEFRRVVGSASIAVRTSDSQTYSEKSAWDTGITSHTTTGITDGSVTCSSFTTVYTSSSDWNTWTLTNVDTTTVAGKMLIPYDSGVLDSFTDGDFTSNPTWTEVAGGFGINGNFLYHADSATGMIYTSLPSGWAGRNQFDITFSYLAGEDDESREYIYVYTNTTSGGVSDHTSSFLIYFYNTTSPTTRGIALYVDGCSKASNATAAPLPSDGWTTFRCLRTYGNDFYIYKNSIELFHVGVSANPIPSSPIFFINRQAVNSDFAWAIDTIFTPSAYLKQGTAISPVIDSGTEDGFNLLWKNIGWTSSTPERTTFEWFVRSSTDSLMGNNPTWVSHSTTTTLGSIVVSTNVTTDRYVQLKATMTTTDIQQTPEIHSVDLNWVTTGYFITPGFITDNINSWGLFEAVETLSGGTISYSVAGSSYSVSASSLQTSASWNTQPNNAIVVIATNTYVYVKASYSLTLGTQTALLDSMTINWYSGDSNSQDFCSLWFEDRMYVGVMQNSSSQYNDAVLVFDPNLNSWWQYKNGVNPSAMISWADKFIIASSTGGVVSEFLNGNTDLGEEINCYWKSKYFTGGDSLGVKVTSLQHYTVIYDTNTTGNFKVDINLNGSNTAENTYTISLAEPSTQDLGYASSNFPNSYNCRYFQFKIYNESGSDLSFHGLVAETQEFPYRTNFGR